MSRDQWWFRQTSRGFVATSREERRRGGRREEERRNMVGDAKDLVWGFLVEPARCYYLARVGIHHCST